MYTCIGFRDLRIYLSRPIFVCIIGRMGSFPPIYTSTPLERGVFLVKNVRSAEVDIAHICA